MTLDAAPETDADNTPDARPGGTIPPKTWDTYGGGGPSGSTSAPGLGKTRITIGSPVSGRVGTPGATTTIEFGISPQQKNDVQ